MYDVVNSGSSFTCPKGPDKTEETFSVKAGDIHTFKTNKAPKYGKNIRCTVNYIIKASCNMMELKCKLELGWGDFFYVQTDDFLKYEMITAHCIYFKYMRMRSHSEYQHLACRLVTFLGDFPCLS